MATTEIRIFQQGDVFVPNVSAVPIVPSDSITFYADPDTQTNLCMTGDTAAILSPHPGLTIMIPPGDLATFQFSAGAPGDYCILTQGPDWPYPDTIDCGAGGSRAVLAIRPGPPPKYSGPDDDPKTL